MVLVEQEVAKMRLERHDHIEKVEKAVLEKLEEKVLPWQERLQALEVKSLQQVNAALANHMASLSRHEGLERSVGSLWWMAIAILVVLCVAAFGQSPVSPAQHQLGGSHRGISKVVWDLSTYDFTNFKKDQEQISETFQLPNGINAWLNLKPKGEARSSEGMAALFLWLETPAVVKWTWQSNSGKVITMECDFSKDLGKGGKPVGWGIRSFMPISETNGSITLHVLSVQLLGSTLRLT